MNKAKELNSNDGSYVMYRMEEVELSTNQDSTNDEFLKISSANLTESGLYKATQEDDIDTTSVSTSDSDDFTYEFEQNNDTQLIGKDLCIVNDYIDNL